MYDLRRFNHEKHLYWIQSTIKKRTKPPSTSLNLWIFFRNRQLWTGKTFKPALPIKVKTVRMLRAQARAVASELRKEESAEWFPRFHWSSIPKVLILEVPWKAPGRGSVMKNHSVKWNWVLHLEGYRIVHYHWLDSKYEFPSPVKSINFDLKSSFMFYLWFFHMVAPW